jgi:hypothetical protein
MSNSLESSYTQPSPPKGTVNLGAPDLTIHPPRSPRTRLGGFVHLPRMIDKARAFVAGKNGDFHYNCPIDKALFEFSGVNPDAFLEEVKKGKSDGELLAYFTASLKPARHSSEIASWSQWFENRAPNNPDSRAFFNDVHRKNGPQREDITTWFEWLELDDYVTYGGKA